MNDLISRQGAIKACFDTRVASIYDISDLIEMLPSAELPIKEKCCVCPHCDNCDVNEDGIIEQKRGEWIDAVIPSDYGGLPVQMCDQCNTFFPLAYTGGGHHFCPNCGARMEE